MNDRLKNLRAEVRKRRSAVTAKENRIKRNTGVDVKDTPLDPRRPTNVVAKYNEPQLRKYLNELNAFMARDNGFVAGANHTPIPKRDWLEYKRIEKKYNDIGAKHFADLAHHEIPFSDNMTVADREKLMVPDSKRAQGEIVHRPYGTIERKASNIKDAAALMKLKNRLEDKLNTDYLPKQIAAGREQLKAMLKSVGDGTLNARADKLSDSQFNILWNYTGFPTSISTITESGGHRSKAAKGTGQNEEYMTGVKEDYSSDIREFFDWAESLPEKGTERTTATARKKTTRSKAKRTRRRA